MLSKESFIKKYFPTDQEVKDQIKKEVAFFYQSNKEAEKRKNILIIKKGLTKENIASFIYNSYIQKVKPKLYADIMNKLIKNNTKTHEDSKELKNRIQHIFSHLSLNRSFYFASKKFIVNPILLKEIAQHCP